jgi:hypothetical protein
MLNISTPSGEYYKINRKGEISHKNYPPSGQWLFLGLQRVHGNRLLNEFIPFAKITPDLLKTLKIRGKNGNPRYTIKDKDHGTIRLWGNCGYHGVDTIWFE